MCHLSLSLLGIEGAFSGPITKMVIPARVDGTSRPVLFVELLG
jgi:hypothetical protein